MLRLGRTLLALLVALFGLALVSLPALAGGGCHNPNPTHSEGAGSAVEIRECAFHPVVLFVRPGTSVTWTHADRPPHNVVGVGWGSVSHFGNGGSVKHTFETAGIYPYQCSLHPGMAGAIVVGDAAAVVEDAGLRVAGATGQVQPEAEPDAKTVPLAVAFITAGLGGILIGRRLAR